MTLAHPAATVPPAHAPHSRADTVADWMDGQLEDWTAGLDDDGRSLVAHAVRWLAARPRQDIRLDTRLNTGEALDAHCAGAVRILAQLGADAQTRVSALLSVLPATEKNLAVLRDGFGQAVADMVQGVHALLRLDQTARAAGENPKQTEMRRKMMLAMAADLRIVLLRLASRLQSLRWYARSHTTCPPAWAQQTLDLYTPLANRLGIWQLKWEMEDLALRFLQPEVYRRIARQLEDKRQQREDLIARMVAQLQRVIKDANIAASVSGRPKHIYSIWNKMRHKQLDFEQLFDLRALRVIVADERTCYAVLALIHARWTALADEFDDYIVRPKPNGYRSLHTVVLDEAGRTFEIQIRTEEMHAFAEYGLAAHWRYKEGGGGSPPRSGDTGYHKKLAWMRRLLAWEQQTREPQAEPPENRADGGTADDHIYVMTPQARVIELPAKATPVDFAYAVHTDLGHRCRGARVDGQMVPLITPLKTGQMVEIIGAKTGGPSRDWLNPQTGYLVSHRARVKVRAWFNAMALRARVEQGQALIDRELQRLGKTAVNREHLAQQLGFAKADELCVAVARDEFRLRHVEAVLRDGTVRTAVPPAAWLPTPPRTAQAAPARGVQVMGVDALMTQLARCCRPAPPDAVGGFITRGRGVSVHRTQCRNYQALLARYPERAIAVAWGEEHGAAKSAANTAPDPVVYPVDLSIHARAHPNLLRELSEVFSRLHLNVIRINTPRQGARARGVHMVFTIEVRNATQIAQALTALNALAEVRARRR